MTYVISKNNKYSPNWDTHKILETVWWGIPIIIILILSIVAWNSSHNLDPFKKISSTEQPLKVQVVATQWRWLFIYPEQNIATLNYLKIPTNRPVNFEITSDAPMNSFWIPDLGGQIYAMSGMKSQLSLEASQDGVYKGVSANISGEGFSDMNFNVYSVTDSQFNQWVSTVQNSDENLNSETYDQIAEKSTDKSLKEYKLSDNNLFDYVLHKGMGHSSNEMSSPMQPQMEGQSY